MHRLFVAIRPPAALLGACLEAMADGPAGWAWQTVEQLHLTLRFIGEVERPMAEDIAVELASIRGKPIELGLDGVGLFDQGSRSALFARAVPRDPLAALHAKIDRALVRLGLPPERRAYLPHITLARRRRAALDPAPWLELHAGLAAPPVTATDFTLYESSLTRHGAHYEPVADYPLA